MFKILGQPATDAVKFPNQAANERPFLSPLAWAYFSAYAAIVYSAFLRAKVLELGIKDASDLVDSEHVKTLVKTTLPHYEKLIDEYDIGILADLIDEIKDKLLAELRAMLEGADADEVALKRSAKS